MINWIKRLLGIVDDDNHDELPDWQYHAITYRVQKGPYFYGLCSKKYSYRTDYFRQWRGEEWFAWHEQSGWAMIISGCPWHGWHSWFPISEEEFNNREGCEA